MYFINSNLLQIEEYSINVNVSMCGNREPSDTNNEDCEIGRDIVTDETNYNNIKNTGVPYTVNAPT